MIPDRDSDSGPEELPECECGQEMNEFDYKKYNGVCEGCRGSEHEAPLMTMPDRATMEVYLKAWEKRMNKIKRPPMYGTWLDYLYSKKYTESHGKDPEKWPKLKEPNFILVLIAGRMETEATPMEVPNATGN